MSKKNSLGLEGIDVKNYFNSLDAPNPEPEPTPDPEPTPEPDPEPEPEPVPAPEPTPEPDPDPSPEPEPEPEPEPDPEPDPDDFNVFQELGKNLGYEIEGDFEDNVDGLAGYTKAVATKMFEENFNEIFETYPDVADYMKYRVNGGDPEKYQEVVTASPLDTEVTEEDIALQKTLVQKYLKAQEYSDEEVNEMIDDYEDSNLLYKEAKRARARLIQKNEKQKQKLIEEQAKAAEAAEKQREEQMEQITELVNKGTVNNVKISDKDQKEFLKWMYNPVDRSGKTQRQLDMEKVDAEAALAMEYLLYKGLDFQSLAESVVTTKKARSIKGQFSKDNKKRVSPKKAPNSKLELPSLKTIFGG
jgi:hypothetical protein